MRNFREDVKVNLGLLEFENRDQAEIFHYWSEQLANAEQALNTLQKKEDRIRKSVKANLRTNWEKHFRNVPTEGALKEKASKDTTVRSLLDDIEEVENQIIWLKWAVKSLEKKKSSLNNLTYLFRANYFARPVASREEEKKLAERSFKIFQEQEIAKSPTMQKLIKREKEK